MIYLLSQLILSIALALLTGGALGWLWHRARSGKLVEQLRQIVLRQNQQLDEARGEVAMLNDDYDELKQRSQQEVERLRHETRQIPLLSDNLEKSQSLVRQLMQRNEARIRELTNENSELTTRLSTLQDRENAFARLQAELDSERRRNASSQSSSDDAGTAARAELDADENAGSSATAAAAKGAKATVAGVAGIAALAGVTHRAKAEETAPAARADSSDLLDDVIEVDDELQAELVSDATGRTLSVSEDDDAQADAAPSETVQPRTGTDAQAVKQPHAVSADARSGSGGKTDKTGGTNKTGETDDDGEDHGPSSTAGGQRSVRTSNRHPEGHDGDDLDGEDDDEFDRVESGPVYPSIADGSLAAYADVAEPVPQLFDAVEHRDDLKQIFGIGPVTEKALNKLGITSYSQLAELKRHEIEKIADALQIFPGRIERDDWVGNARRQLEDVLEEL